MIEMAVSIRGGITKSPNSKEYHSENLNLELSKYFFLFNENKTIWQIGFEILLIMHYDGQRRCFFNEPQLNL